MANSVLAKMAVQISANTAEFNKKISETQKSLSGFQKSTLDLAQNLGLAFGTQQVVDFAFEVSKLAGEAEGVKRAFDKLPNSLQLMQELQRVTAGTVSELDLMKRTVQAANFGISLESLPKLLEFAAVRAQQTGQSVDYLVDSIVTGIGRKSPLILDNLGISAVRLKEQFGGAALEAQSIGDVALAVGKIAEEELSKMGSLAETTSTKIARLDATWQDFKVTLGTTANESGILNFFLQLGTEALKSLGGIEDAEEKLLKFEGGIKRFNKEISPTGGGAFELNKAMKDLTLIAEEAGKKVIFLSDGLGKTVAVMKPFNETVKTAKDEVKKVGDEAEKSAPKVKKLTDELSRRFQFIVPSDAGFLDSAGDVANVADANEKVAKSTELVTEGYNLMTASMVGAKVETVALGEATESTIKRMEINLKQFVPVIADFAANIAEGLGGAIAGTSSFGKSFLKAIANFMGQLGRQMIALGIAKLNLDKLISVPGAGAALVAAGLALTVAASAVSGTIAGGYSNRGVSRGVSAPVNNFSRSTTVLLDGQFKIEGRDLVYIVDKNKSLDSKRKG